MFKFCWHKWKRLPEEDGGFYEVYICEKCEKKTDVYYSKYPIKAAYWGIKMSEEKIRDMIMSIYMKLGELEGRIKLLEESKKE